MAKNKTSNPKAKQFTPREIVLLMALVMALVLYAYFTYFYEPVTNAIAQLEIDNNTLEAEYASRQGLILRKPDLIDEFNEVNLALNAYKNQYFKTSDQEHFIKTLEQDIINDRELDIINLSFTETLPSMEFMSEEESSVELISSTVSFPFKGTYEKLIEVINRIERYENIIRINNFNISYVDSTSDSVDSNSGDEYLYEGIIDIEFFIIPQDYEYIWSNKPEYSMAESYENGLFNYDDGFLGIPPFLVKKEPVVEPSNPLTPLYPSGGDSNQGSLTPGNDDILNPDPDETVNGNSGNENPGNGLEYTTYVVKPGDTIFDIAMTYFGSPSYVEEIMALNKITNPRKLRSGSTILLPLGK